MSRTLAFRNRQRVRRIDTTLLRRLTLHVLSEQLKIADFELAIHLVAAPEMTRVNQTYLDHEGSTDVITFDHIDPVEADVRRLSLPLTSKDTESESPHVDSYRKMNGEIFLCLDDAVAQARQFRTTWQSEVARYVIHGLLHLCGHDDLKPSARRVMKREENRLLQAIGKRFPLAQLESRIPRRGTKSFATRRPRSAN